MGGLCNLFLRHSLEDITFIVQNPVAASSMRQYAAPNSSELQFSASSPPQKKVPFQALGARRSDSSSSWRGKAIRVDSRSLGKSRNDSWRV